MWILHLSYLNLVILVNLGSLVINLVIQKNMVVQVLLVILVSLNIKVNLVGQEF